MAINNKSGFLIQVSGKWVLAMGGYEAAQTWNHPVQVEYPASE
jgi:hypothetical protein